MIMITIRFIESDIALIECTAEIISLVHRSQFTKNVDIYDICCKRTSATGLRF